MPADREAFWRDILARWKHSGLSISEFCQQHQLCKSSFHRWKNKLANLPTPATFVPVTFVAETFVDLTLPNDIVVKLPLASDPTLVTQLVKAVKSC